MCTCIHVQYVGGGGGGGGERDSTWCRGTIFKINGSTSVVNRANVGFPT